MSDSRIGRRSFLKLAALGAGSTMAFGENETFRKATNEEIKNPYEGSKKVRTICSICSAGCGIEAEVKDGVWVRQDMAMFHPISQGSHCSKGIDQIDLTKSKQRIKFPMKKVNGKSLLKLLSIGIKNGSEVTVYAEGPDADQAVEVLGELLATIRD